MGRNRQNQAVFSYSVLSETRIKIWIGYPGPSYKKKTKPNRHVNKNLGQDFQQKKYLIVSRVICISL